MACLSNYCKTENKISTKTNFANFICLISFPVNTKCPKTEDISDQVKNNKLKSRLFNSLPVLDTTYDVECKCITRKS